MRIPLTWTRSSTWPCSSRSSNSRQRRWCGGAAISSSTPTRRGRRARGARSNIARCSSRAREASAAVAIRAKTAGTPAPKQKLAEYARKRDFSRTPEPEATVATPGNGGFVVQKHDARRLHYDLRLELDGVLKSWAVTRGPSLTVGEKRLA